MISKNLDAVIVSWNEGPQLVLRHTEAEALRQPTTILIPPELPDEVQPRNWAPGQDEQRRR
jgi:hypothetical protein